MRAGLGIASLAFVVGTGCVQPLDDYPPPSGSRVLPIANVFQETAEWCWLASAQMILTYYQVPPVNNDYQCGIMAAVAGPQSVCFYDCTQCVVGSGTDAEAAAVLGQYSAIVQQYVYPQYRIPQVAGQLNEGIAPPGAIAQEIDAGRPIELGVTVGGPFQGMAGHAVVLVGYDATNPASLLLTIDDPFPYDQVLGPGQNPYYQLGAPPSSTGQYVLDYDVAAQGLQWSATILTTSH